MARLPQEQDHREPEERERHPGEEYAHEVTPPVSVDPTVTGPGPADAARLPVHHLVARAGGVVVENLTGLEEVDFADPLLSVLPLRLTGADGAPCRAVALQVIS